MIFLCLTTSAIHIKLAGDLSTDSFLLALRTFISGQVYAKFIRYDNHTNFVVANNKLNLPIKEIDQNKLHKFSNHQNIECIFNTPASQIMDGRSMRILSQISQNHVKSNWKTLHIYGWRSPNISLQSAISFKWTSLNLYQRLYIWLRVINSKPFAHWRTITKSESWKLHK